MTTISLLPSLAPRRWYAAQLAGVTLTVALLAALVAWPSQALHVLWDMVIPLLPAVFLVNPLLWRNVCPLATLNAGTGTRIGQRMAPVSWTRKGWALGIALLFIMVPARRFLFNTNGLALAVTVVAVACLAIGAGVIFRRRSAFCNTLCPVLPVEKLYGQAPLVSVGNSRCVDCSVCTPVGCIDLAGTKTLAQTVGRTRRSHSWLTTSFGIFAASFPGFVVGYFTTTNGPLSSAGAVYAHIMLYALASYAIVFGIVHLANVSSTMALRFLGAGALMLYYWLVAPSLAAAYAMPIVGIVGVRAAAIALIGVWLASAVAPRVA